MAPASALHSVSLPGQTHWPWLHTSVGRHVLPQAPQLFGSEALLTQCCGTAPHRICEGIVPHGRHVAPTQLSAAEQLMPQPPQLFESLLMSAHVRLEVPQTVCPVGHWHPLFTQVAPAGQAAPQAPQLFSSLEMDTHVPASPVTHSMSFPTQRQTPPWHASPAPQTAPQLPQFCESFIGSEHIPLQSSMPASQAGPSASPASTAPFASIVASLVRSALESGGSLPGRLVCAHAVARNKRATMTHVRP